MLTVATLLSSALLIFFPTGGKSLPPPREARYAVAPLASLLQLGYGITVHSGLCDLNEVH